MTNLRLCFDGNKNFQKKATYFFKSSELKIEDNSLLNSVTLIKSTELKKGERNVGNSMQECINCQKIDIHSKTSLFIRLKARKTF